jgi:hypothetical protein
MRERWYRHPSVKAQYVGGVFAIVAAMVGGVFTCVAQRQGSSGPASSPSPYEMKVLVVDPAGRPVEDAKVWMSLGGEPRRVSGGWQFDIPWDPQQVRRRIKVFASRESAFLAGVTEYELGTNRYPVVSVRLEKSPPADIRGIVVDETGHGIGSVTIGVVGASDIVATGTNGHFSLPTDATDGEQVLVRAYKTNYMPVTQWHPAGRQPVTIILQRQ